MEHSLIDFHDYNRVEIGRMQEDPTRHSDNICSLIFVPSLSISHTYFQERALSLLLSNLMAADTTFFSAYSVKTLLRLATDSISYILFTPHIVNKRFLLKILNGIGPVRNKLSPNYADGNITL